MNGLSYTFTAYPDGTIEVWTPDSSGARIGSGKSKGAALLDANRTLMGTVKEICRELSEATPSLTEANKPLLEFCKAIENL